MDNQYQSIIFRTLNGHFDLKGRMHLASLKDIRPKGCEICFVFRLRLTGRPISSTSVIAVTGVAGTARETRLSTGRHRKDGYLLSALDQPRDTTRNVPGIDGTVKNSDLKTEQALQISSQQFDIKGDVNDEHRGMAILSRSSGGPRVKKTRFLL